MNLLAKVSRLAISPLPAPTGWYAIPLRLIVGFGFLQHGYAKLARGPEDFVNILRAMGVSGRLSAWLDDHHYRNHRGDPDSPRGACSSRDDTDGHRSARSNIHGASPERLYFGQAPILRCCRRPFRAARVRDEPSLSRGTYRIVFGGSRSAFSRWTFAQIGQPRLVANPLTRGILRRRTPPRPASHEKRADAEAAMSASVVGAIGSSKRASASLSRPMNDRLPGAVPIF